MVGFCQNLAKLPARTASSRTQSQTTLSKLRTPRPKRLCALESGEDIMSSSVRRSWTRRAFSAIINCSAQEYDTSSTTNDEGDHCEKQEGGCQDSTTCSVEYSSLGSKTDGAEPPSRSARLTCPKHSSIKVVRGEVVGMSGVMVRSKYRWRGYSHPGIHVAERHPSVFR